MTRERYVLFIPLSVLFVVILGFVVSFLLPSLGFGFYLILTALCGVLIVIFDRILRRRVDEPLIDERITGISDRASYVAFRVTFSVVFVAGIVLMYAFPDRQELRFIGMGLWFAIAVQGLVYGVSYLALRARTQ